MLKHCFSVRSIALVFASVGFYAADAHAQFRSYGRTCGLTTRGELQLGDPQRVLELTTSGGAPAGVALLAIGNQQATGTLPGGCPLHVLPQILLPFVVDLQGGATLRFSLPASLALGRTVFQTAQIDPQTNFLRTSNGLELQPVQAIRSLDENFTTTTQSDPDLDGALWGNGALAETTLGGTGILGEFRAVDGKDLNLRDASGRKIYEFDIDRVEVPATQTLDGTRHVVTNGVLEYASFVIAADERVRFVGSKPVQIRVAGAVRIEGVLEMHVPEHKDTAPQAGSLGGASGGRGAVGNGSGVIAAAQDGGDVILPRGHPRAASAIGTGGKASTSFPASGLDRDIVWIQVSGFKIFVRQMAAGGGGGELWNAGQNWQATGGNVFEARTPNYPILGAYQTTEFPPASKAGVFFPVLPTLATRSSLETFVIGGAGGGGAGTHPAYSPAPISVTWSPGGGGAAGGGALAIRCGGNFVASGLVEARGGSGQRFRDKNAQAPAPSPGGAGSGGSILVQTPRSAKGVLDVRGGLAGTFTETSPLLEIRGESGRGGSGYARVESASTKLSDFVGSTPPLTVDNVGSVRVSDFGDACGSGSKWYRLTQARSIKLWSYTIDALVDNVPVTYSDAPGSMRRATEGEAVVVSFQRGTVDISGQLRADLTPWSLGSARALNDIAGDGNAVRFFLRLDRKLTSTNRIQVRRVQLKFD